MFRKKKIIFIIGVIGLCLLCGFQYIKALTTLNIENSKKGTPSATPTVKIEVTPISTVGLKAVEGYEEFDEANLPIIAAIPEEEIYLYAIKPYGTVLYFKGRGFYYEWGYKVSFLPNIYYDDFDGDGSKEIAAIICVTYGTSYYIDELHIIETSDKEYLSEDINSKDCFECNPEYFKDRCYPGEEYIAQLNKAINFKVNKTTEGYKADLKINSRNYHFDKIDIYEEGDEIENRYSVEGIEHFYCKDNKLIAKFAIGYIHKSSAVPDYFGDIVADVKYLNGKFKLENMHFEDFEKISD